MEKSVRRVITGHNENGQAVVSQDGPPPVEIELKSAPGLIFHEVWRTTEMPVRVDNGADPTPGPLQLNPGPGGSVLRMVDFPPETPESLEHMQSAFGEIGAANASTSGNGGPHPAMHRTETVDYGFVMEGEIVLVLDDSEIPLKAGDVVIQRGTNHAWSNRSGKMCRMAFVLLNGRFADELKKTS